jgi:hypothetical protein
LRLGQGGGDVFQISTDLGRLLGLSTQRLGGALRFGRVVDRAITVLAVPGRLTRKLKVTRSW